MAAGKIRPPAMTSAAALSPLPVYDSAARRPRPLEEAAALWRFRGLIYEFALRDLKVRHKRSSLGLLWALLSPLGNMLVLTLVFGALLKSRVDNYPVFFLSGSIFWTFMAQTVSGIAAHAPDADDLASRLYVPRSVFVIAGLSTGLTQLLLSLIPLFAVMAVTRRPPPLTSLLLPLPVALLALFTAGLGFLLYAASSRFADAREMLLVALQAWFFLTPVVYPAAIIPAQHAWLTRCNPMHYFVGLCRSLLYDGEIPGAGRWLIAAGCAGAMFAAGYLLFCAAVQRRPERA
jgi:ABC-type polysaccharide/polyol phosphate export permease